VRVLIACEFSGVVRDAFVARGHDAWSCDLLPTETMGRHIQGDALEAVNSQAWDLLIAHPPCTFRNVASAWALKDPDFKRYPGVGYHQRVKSTTLTGAARRKAKQEADAFLLALLNADVARVCVENPIGLHTPGLPPPTQTVQPYQFGADASKATCLWLCNLPPLSPTQYVAPRIVDGKPRWGNQTDSGQNKITPSEKRWAERSITYPGIAAAMAAQWG
jgi:hypothetical protein